jgi:arylsulfatase A-like enzyme
MYDPADMVPGTLLDEEHEMNPPHFGLTQQESPDFSTVFPTDKALHGASSHLRDREELKKDMACYYGMVSFMDREIGRVLQRLDELGMAGNTMVVFSTDHGHFLGQHGLIAKAIHQYEDLIRIPYLVRWPARVPAAKVSTAIQNLVDLAPTFAAAAGLDIPGAMTGVDQREAWAGGAAARAYSITENHHGTNECHMRTYVNQRHKITVYRVMDDGELFDLEADPGERRNLWRDPAAAELKSRMLLEFMQATLETEPMRMPRISGA